MRGYSVEMRQSNLVSIVMIHSCLTRIQMRTVILFPYGIVISLLKLGNLFGHLHAWRP